MWNNAPKFHEVLRKRLELKCLFRYVVLKAVWSKIAVRVADFVKICTNGINTLLDFILRKKKWIWGSNIIVILSLSYKDWILARKRKGALFVNLINVADSCCRFLHFYEVKGQMRFEIKCKPYYKYIHIQNLDKLLVSM